MQRDGHRVWGLVVYRCDYESDEQWTQCLTTVRDAVDETFRESNSGDDLRDSMQLTVMNDKELYSRLSPVEVRSHFRQWRDQAIAREQGRPARDADFFSPRYAYCVQIDSGALHSVLLSQTSTAAQHGGDTGYANVVSVYEGHAIGARPEYYEELGDDNFDTGWMRVAYGYLVEFAWYWAGDINAWYGEYQPPPKIHDG